MKVCYCESPLPSQVLNKAKSLAPIETKLAAQMAEDFVNSNVAKAIQRNELGNALDALIKAEKNPDVKKILQKIKLKLILNLNTIGLIQFLMIQYNFLNIFLMLLDLDLAFLY